MVAVVHSAPEIDRFPVQNLRQLIVWMRLAIALVAVAGLSAGCEDCWHHLKEVASLTPAGVHQLDAGEQDGLDVPHFCSCSCSTFIHSSQVTLASLPLIPAEKLELSPDSTSLAHSPPFLPPKG